MPRTVAVLESPHNPHIEMTSFNGGVRGTCMQMTQDSRGNPPIFIHDIQMTREQVQESIVVMQKWLGEA